MAQFISPAAKGHAPRLAAAVALALVLVALMGLQLRPSAKRELNTAAQPRLQLGTACDCSQCPMSSAGNATSSGGAEPAAEQQAECPEQECPACECLVCECPACPVPEDKAGEPKCPDRPEPCPVCEPAGKGREQRREAGGKRGRPAAAGAAGKHSANGTDAALNATVAAQAALAAAKAANAAVAAQLTQYDADRVQRLFEYEPFLPPRAIQRGLYSLGDPSRMRRFTHKLLSGEAISMSAVGGSVTAGQGALYGGGYQERIWNFVREVSPREDHTLKHGAFGGSTSGIFTVCCTDIVQPDADLVMVEFSENDSPDQHGQYRDPRRMGVERLLRKLLEFKNRPAVVFVNHYAWMLAGGRGDRQADFTHGAENDFNVLGQYYGVPSLSLRAAAYHMIRRNETGYRAHVWRREHEQETDEDELFYYDEIHPQDRTGHHALADLLISLVREAARGLALVPLLEEDEVAAQEPLPPPMIPGNYQRRSSTCLLQRDFERVVAAQQGFEWRNERPGAELAVQKWGWISDSPGSWAELEVDTTTSMTGELKSDEVDIVLAYLKSYEQMGMARVECVSGCTCEPSEIDGYWEQEASLSELHRFRSTEHEKCRLRVTVLDSTHSPDGGRKVKLVGVMVIEGGSGIIDGAIGIQLDLFANRARPKEKEEAGGG